MELPNPFKAESPAYSNLRQRLELHEEASKKKLHEEHPHLKGLFAKYNINLRDLRRKGAKVAAAAAILGAFLAIPHLIGNPPIQPQQPQTGHEIQKSIGQSEGHQAGHLPGTDIGKPGTPPSPGNPPSDSDDSKSRGHTFGRSYMAPPKEHGFHDLGLHKGEVKNPQVPDVGTNPTDLGVNKGGNNT